MNRVHCNNCNVEVGCRLPFLIGDTTWFRLEVFGEEYDYCLKCKPTIEKEVNNLLRKTLEVLDTEKNSV